MQASCNDWHLDSELSSAYLLEKLVGSMAKAGVEAGSPDDGADTWVATPYAMLEPCTIDGPLDPRCTGTWSRPWADEMKVGFFASMICCAKEHNCSAALHISTLQHEYHMDVKKEAAGLCVGSVWHQMWSFTMVIVFAMGHRALQQRSSQHCSCN